MQAKASPKDLYLGVVTTLLGGVLLYLAMRDRWSPSDMLPGIEGTLTTGVLGTIVLLLHPLPYARALLYSMPVLAIEYWACSTAGGPAKGIVGLQLIIVGFIGLVVGSRSPAAGERQKA
jgi:hypothetical protein